MKEHSLLRYLYKVNWVLLRDLLVAAGWTFLLDYPAFFLFMVTLDYEHYLCGMQPRFSVYISFSEIFPYHTMSLIIWLAAFFIAALSIRRTFRQKEQLISVRARLSLSQRQGLTDGLTGIWNRRGFDELMKTTLTNAHNYGHLFSVIFCDVDGFKQYNDTQGHLAGDDALKQIASLLANQIRSNDIVARYGGDEFVTLCPEIDSVGAAIMIERLAVALVPTPLTLSFGVATYPLDGYSTQACLRQLTVGYINPKPS